MRTTNSHKVNPLKPAVLIIDMLNDFVTGALKCERAIRIIPNIKQLIETARKREVPVIYTNDTHLHKVDKEFQIWPPHAVSGTWGGEVIDELKPAETDYVIHKRRYSAFFATSLDLLLRELEVDTLILTGLVTNVCIQHTAADAFFLGYKILAPEDCIAAVNEEIHKNALNYMKTFYGCKITNLNETLDLLGQT